MQECFLMSAYSQWNDALDNACHTHVTLNGQIVHSVGKYGLLGNLAQLELFEIGEARECDG